MNKYESIYIIKPTVEEEGIKALVERFSGRAGRWKMWMNGAREGWHILLKISKRDTMS
jgi:hypothetical protein